MVKQDTSMSNGSSSSPKKVQPVTSSSKPSGAMDANGIAREGSSEESAGQSAAASTAERTALPTEDPGPTDSDQPPSTAKLPSKTDDAADLETGITSATVQKTAANSTTVAATDASKSRENGNDSETSWSPSSLARGVQEVRPIHSRVTDLEEVRPMQSLVRDVQTVPTVPPLVKRKSPRTADNEALSNGKKRKLSTVPNSNPTADSTDEPETSAMSEDSPERKPPPIPLDQRKPPPIPLDQRKPPPTYPDNSSESPLVKATKRASRASKQKLPVSRDNKTTAKHKHKKKSSDDFVTIQVGPIEDDLKKKSKKGRSDSAKGKNKKKEKTNATNASSSSSSTTTSAIAANTEIKKAAEAVSSVAPTKAENTTEIISQYTSFPPIKGGYNLPLRPLNRREREDLEECLGIDGIERFDNVKGDRKWDDDWFGALNNCNYEVENPIARAGERQKKRSLLEWVGINTKPHMLYSQNKTLRLLVAILRHVYQYPKIPEQAKYILSNTDLMDPAALNDSIQRLSIDPLVLQQDGWTTAPAKEPQGASGGAYRIGEKIWWQGYLGVVIAYVHDDDIGDLWKAIWIEDLATFDLEREELEDSRRKYLRKEASSTDKKKKLQAHNSVKNNFTVAGIEHGIVLATSYARGARHGVFWPARVLHASELVGNTSRRSKSKKKIDVVFFAPYWNIVQSSGTNGARQPYSGTIAGLGESIFKSGPLLEVESIDANESCIQSYPYNAEMGLDIDSLRTSFKFLGLPKAAFTRYVDSQRLALGFKTYSETELGSTSASDSDRTSAALLEGHPLAVQAPLFPSSVLQLPFAHILSQLPHPNRQKKIQNYNDTVKAEPALRFDRILEAMKPPICWGLEPNGSSDVKETPQLKSLIASPISFLDKNKGTRGDPYNTGRFLTGLLSLQSLLSDNSPTSRMLKNSLNELVSTFAKNKSLHDLQRSESKKKYIKSLNRTWVVVKSKGETLILAAMKHKKFLPFLKDWRRCCERIYKHINVGLGSNGKSWVITDSRCNLHLTSSECFERAVRLPAALKGARQAKGNVEIIHSVEDEYLDLAENDVIIRAHTMSYIQRLKKRCMAAPEDQVVALTDDSDGNGGEDTKGSKGTWNAALLGVGAALKGLDMIINGECLNVFCATRPPGHHAGRELHAMKAVSNGFCILNSVACAALYATTPIAEGGLGLSRVAVIDIDVHHGNGTQDILCSTYDPRFLYVSMHAGGADINGLDIEDDELEQVQHHLGGGDEKKGIFPGRCGDVSPHKGVLNIPLGGRVTSHALGTALVTKVTPAVEEFNPEVIIISAGFDAHKNDPLNMGGLTAEDFGTLTEVICKLAYKCCSGRVLSVMEGGYGVPCCRPQNFEAPAKKDAAATPVGNESASDKASEKPKQQQFAQLQCLELGSDLPPDMMDVISSYALARRLNKCHEEGFVHCVKEHVSALARCNEVRR